MLDQLLLLSAGQVAYFGPASAALSHFEGLGLICPNQTNPADFLLDILATQHVTDGVDGVEAEEEGHADVTHDVASLESGQMSINDDNNNNNNHHNSEKARDAMRGQLQGQGQGQGQGHGKAMTAKEITAAWSERAVSGEASGRPKFGQSGASGRAGGGPVKEERNGWFYLFLVLLSRYELRRRGIAPHGYTHA